MTITYYVTNKENTGIILFNKSKDDLLLNASMISLEVKDEDIKETKEEIVEGYNLPNDGLYYIKGTEPKNPNQYAVNRAQEYPSIQEQLDMMYWDRINGTDLWKETIDGIKIRFPKKEI